MGPSSDLANGEPNQGITCGSVTDYVLRGAWLVSSHADVGHPATTDRTAETGEGLSAGGRVMVPQLFIRSKI